MPFSTYILYSEAAEKYYVGSTSLLVLERLSYHNGKNKGFTGQTKDWKVVHIESFNTIQESRRKERQIKKRGAQRYLLSMP